MMNIHSRDLMREGTTRQVCNITVVDLIDPKGDGDDDEEHRKLDNDREYENKAVSSAHRQRSTNSLERLPPEGLST